MPDGVRLIGTGRLVERLWTSPALAVIGIDAPSWPGAQHPRPGGPRQVTLRLAPGDRANGVTPWCGTSSRTRPGVPR